MSIQVPFESESTSDTEKLFGRCFEFRTLFLFSKKNILYCYIQNLLVIQFRCLRVSGALYVEWCPVCCSNVLNAAQFSHNDYIIVLMRCLSRFHL